MMIHDPRNSMIYNELPHANLRRDPLPLPARAHAPADYGGHPAPAGAGCPPYI